MSVAESSQPGGIRKEKKMDGKTLRGRVEAFDDVLTDVKKFIKDKKKLTKQVETQIERISELCKDLFYLIPLE